MKTDAEMIGAGTGTGYTIVCYSYRLSCIELYSTAMQLLMRLERAQNTLLFLSLFLFNVCVYKISI